MTGVEQTGVSPPALQLERETLSAPTATVRVVKITMPDSIKRAIANSLARGAVKLAHGEKQ